MITYKNISFSAKTFYGVKFEPGDIKEVPGYINCRGMRRIFAAPAKAVKPVAQEQPVTVKVETRGRKKKTIEPEKDSFAETTEIKITSEEETSNGNPS